jgi:hypothetical protein
MPSGTWEFKGLRSMINSEVPAEGVPRLHMIPLAVSTISQIGERVKDTK